MRGVSSLILLTTLSGWGCASTVARLDGEFPTRVGAAKTACEQENWLVAAPTRADFVQPNGRRAERRDDGAALYRIGSDHPESIPALGERFGGGEVFERHAQPVRHHDSRQLLAGGLGAAAAVAITVGTILFVTAFETRRSESGDEEQHVSGGKAVAGGILVGAGFGFGFAGIGVNPGQAERSRAEASRYVFLPPADPRADVVELAARNNQAVRERCTRGR